MSLGGPVQAPEDGSDFLARQHDGETFGSARPHDPVEPWHVELENLAIQEEQRAERRFWVDAATLPSTASAVRKRVISAAPISAG